MANCNICGKKLDHIFSEKISNEDILKFRETLPCSNCNSISRDRLMILSLTSCIFKKTDLFKLESNKDKKILEASGSRNYTKYLEKIFSYSNTRYLNVPKELFSISGLMKIIWKLRKGRKFVNFENIPFENDQFDGIMAGDVFEHIRLDDKAFSEIFRILKKGGYFFLTVPFGYNMEETLIRVKPVGNKDVFLLPPEFHGEKSLSYRVYGRDIFQKLQNIGFSVSYLNCRADQYAISPQEIFICRKEGKPDTEKLEEVIHILKKEEYVI